MFAVTYLQAAGEEAALIPCFLLGGVIIVLLAAGLHSLFAGPPRQIICPNPNCGYKGPAKRQARGSFFDGLVLCLLGLLPGLIYFAFRSGYRYSCPQCGMQIASDN